MLCLLVCSEPAAFSLYLHRAKLTDLVENIPRQQSIQAKARLLFTLPSSIYERDDEEDGKEGKERGRVRAKGAGREEER